MVVMWNLLPLVAAVHVSFPDWNVQNAYLDVVAACNLYVVPGTLCLLCHILYLCHEQEQHQLYITIF